MSPLRDKVLTMRECALTRELHGTMKKFKIKAEEHTQVRIDTRGSASILSRQKMGSSLVILTAFANDRMCMAAGMFFEETYHSLAMDACGRDRPFD